ncbi:LPS export ABC transporter periplasmic protein LptC [Prochlorococcus sp. MIT 0603]|uniref:LPS export ABC transporter periplasmic protein LptC n=1 Tax=unclassified Prochlorococcus TaxID=2627481 RepID=UPI0005601586|nr:LPS export ABC transporter periplasmic protein LptC [Prochlorococcus sp. MIT 0603]
MQVIQKSRLSILFLFFLISSCSSNSNVVKEISVNSFKFKDIKLEQLDKNGLRRFLFVTKNASLDESSKTIYATNPLVTFYHNKKPSYTIRAKEASLINNGETVLLENDVLMSSLKKSNLILKTNKVLWIKDSSTAILDGFVESTINGSSFVSDSAIYKHKINTIEFNGVKNYFYRDATSSSIISVAADQAIWYGNKKKLEFNSSGKQVKTNIKLY